MTRGFKEGDGLLAVAEAERILARKSLLYPLVERVGSLFEEAVYSASSFVREFDGQDAKRIIVGGLIGAGLVAVSGVSLYLLKYIPQDLAYNFSLGASAIRGNVDCQTSAFIQTMRQNLNLITPC